MFSPDWQRSKHCKVASTDKRGVPTFQSESHVAVNFNQSKHTQGIICDPNAFHSKNPMLKRLNRNRVRGIATASEAERWFQGLLDAAPDAMVVVDQDAEIILVNTQTERLFGYQREEILGLDMEVLVPERLREQHRLHRKGFFAQPHVRPMGGGLELFGLRKGGGEFPVEVSLSPVETTESVLVTSAIRDITERKQVEESRFRLAAIVESSEDAIISKSLDAVVVSWNAGAQHTFGYTEQEAVGRPITILIPSELREEENKILERLRAGERIDHYETVRVTKAGNKINVSLSISPIKDSTGRIVGFSKIARDITERKLAEEAVRQNEQRLRLAMQADGCTRMTGVSGQTWWCGLRNMSHF
jgi:PAS domain S-box-containing protein